MAGYMGSKALNGACKEILERNEILFGIGKPNSSNFVLGGARRIAIGKCFSPILGVFIQAVSVRLMVDVSPTPSDTQPGLGKIGNRLRSFVYATKGVVAQCTGSSKPQK